MREINAFALPGGPMFVNRGMIEAAKTEGEVAGVMAHEMSHVALRHGTAQASKATKYEIGADRRRRRSAPSSAADAGSVIAQGTQFGLGTAFLRFSREYEKQADIEGAQIMARAGYDPRDMANMFKTIEKQGGSGGPQWLSDHPNPGNRYDVHHARKRSRCACENADATTRARSRARRRACIRCPPAPTTEQATQERRRQRAVRPGRRRRAIDRQRVEPPSVAASRRTTRATCSAISVPSNWRELPGNNSVTFAPEGAYGTANQQSVFTHGVEVGRRAQRDARSADGDRRTDAVAGAVEPATQAASGYGRGADRRSRRLQTTLDNVSEATGRNERINVFTTLMQDGTLFYLIGVAPDNEFNAYEPVFHKVASSVQFAR